MNWTEPRCQYKMSGYYGGVCDCGNDYVCNKHTKTCELNHDEGDLSKGDCEAIC